MAKVSISAADWNKVCPPSCEDANFNRAITDFLKLLPDDEPANIKTASQCQSAEKEGKELLTALSKMLNEVLKAKDNAKNAGKKLTTWIAEMKVAITEIGERSDELEVDAKAGKLTKELEATFKEIMADVHDISHEVTMLTESIKNCNGIRDEAVIAMVDRAEDLRATGNTGKTPADFFKDAEFKKIYDAWDKQLTVCVGYNKKVEAEIGKRKQTAGKIKALLTSLKQAEAELSAFKDSKSSGIAEFGKIRDQIEKFQKERDTRYNAFENIPTPFEDVRGADTDDLEKRLATLKKVDVTQYYDSEMARHGFNARLFVKTVADMKGKHTRLIALEDSIGPRAKAGDNVSADVKTVKDLMDDIVATEKKYVAARSNTEVAHLLSDEHNAARKKEIDHDLANFKTWAADAVRFYNLAVASTRITIGTRGAA